MRYGWVVGAVIAALAGSAATAEVTREECLDLKSQAEEARKDGDWAISGLGIAIREAIREGEEAVGLDDDPAHALEEAVRSAWGTFSEALDDICPSDRQ